MSTTDQTAQAIMDLINSSPRSPRKDQIAAILQGLNPSTSAIQVEPAVGAFVQVGSDGDLIFQGWRTTLPMGVFVEDTAKRAVCIAILDWMRAKAVNDLAASKGD